MADNEMQKWHRKCDSEFLICIKYRSCESPSGICAHAFCIFDVRETVCATSVTEPLLCFSINYVIVTSLHGCSSLCFIDFILRSSCVAKLFVAINVVIILQVATEQM